MSRRDPSRRSWWALATALALLAVPVLLAWLESATPPALVAHDRLWRANDVEPPQLPAPGIATPPR